MDELLRRARIAWAGYAGLGDGFRPGQVHLGVNAGSGLCPPGWAGIVVLGDAAIVTAPDAQAERELRRALAGVPVGRLTDPPAVMPAGDAAVVLGPANLAFTDPARFSGAALSAGTAGAGGAALSGGGALSGGPAGAWDTALPGGPAGAGDTAEAGGFAGPGASLRPVTQMMPATDQRRQRLLASVSAAASPAGAV
jgi:hypothetical protein